MANNSLNGEAKQEDRHAGKFVGGYLSPDQVAKIDAVATKYDEVFGDAGRNRTRALRWILDNFDPEWLADFPKSLASKSLNALNKN